jgi:hypothetical protein
MEHRRVLAFLDLDPALVERDRAERAELVTAAIAQVFVAPQFRFLRRKGITVDRRLRRAADGPDIFQPGEARAFVKQVVGRKRREPEMLPPEGFLFPAMPIQNFREQPARLLFRRPLQHVGRHIRRELGDDRVDPLQPGGDDLARFAFRRDRPLDPRALRDEDRALRLQPVPQRGSGNAIVAVVPGDERPLGHANQPEITEFQPGLDLGKRQVRFGKADGPGKTVERLELLDGVAFEAGAEPIPHDAVEIDEALAAQQLVNLFFARGIPAHESLQRRRLVGREMIDVQIREFLELGHHEVDEPLEGRLLVRPRQRPVRRAAQCSIGAGEGIAEQIFETALPRERIAFEIEEDVARRRFRQKRQAEPRHGGQQFMEDLPRFPTLHLNSRLFAQPFIGLTGTAVR